eukprot:scaffold83138_cov30-Prasinocladus_malaysianus.AAC.1
MTAQGRRDGTTKDEPFAWESREFLRKKAIGQVCHHRCLTKAGSCLLSVSSNQAFHKLGMLAQPCVFRIDYTLEGVAREFGSVFIGTSNPPENLAVSIVEAGWARVRGGQQQSPYMEELTRVLELAQQHELGMFTK